MKHQCTELHNKDMNKTWMFHGQRLQMLNAFCILLYYKTDV